VIPPYWVNVQAINPLRQLGTGRPSLWVSSYIEENIISSRLKKLLKLCHPSGTPDFEYLGVYAVYVHESCSANGLWETATWLCPVAVSFPGALLAASPTRNNAQASMA
jgi:hypothetical protein